MIRTFGLELLENVLKSFPNIFLKVRCECHLLFLCVLLAVNIGADNLIDLYRSFD